MAAPMATTRRPGHRPGHRPGYRTLRTRYVALRFDVRVLTMCAIALALLAATAVWAMTLGTMEIPARDVVRALTGRGGDDIVLVVRDFRLPRVLSAVLVGMALAIAGAIFQGIVSNPLVSPDIIGINAGATVVAVAFLILAPELLRQMPLAAFAGAMAAAAVIYGLSWKKGIVPNRLILVGIGVGAVLAAGTTFLTVRFPIEQVRPALVWTMGSIYASDWDDVVVLALVIGITLPAAMLLMQPLRTLQFGDVVTRSLGVPLERTRLALIVLGCALAGVSVAVSGPIGFIALMVPHMARLLAGPQSESVLLLTGLLGGLVVLASDVIAQHFLPITVPVGVVTAAVGAPYFLFLLYRTNTQA